MKISHKRTAVFDSKRRVPRPPVKCDGQLYTVRATDSLFLIARRFGVTVEQILAVNPQIKDPNLIFVGQVICIPRVVRPKDLLRVVSVEFLSETGQPLPIIDGAVRLAARTIVRATFTMPVARAFFFIEPTGTETCELARLIGVNCPGAVTAEILWEVPPGTLGRVFVVGCTDSSCAKSDEILVVREDEPM
jgi:LysM repeat protein